MIVISGALVLVALVLLVVGITMRELPFVHGSIAVSLLAFVFLIIGVLQRRGEQFPMTDASARLGDGPGEPQESVTLLPRQGLAGAAAPAQPPPQPQPQREPRTPAGAPVPTSRAERSDADDEQGADEPVVLVVPGRPRYHVDGCRYLNGKEVEEIPVLDARNEGFSPCGVCRPDEVLAVQAHVRGGLSDSASGSGTATADAAVPSGSLGWAAPHPDDDDRPGSEHEHRQDDLGSAHPPGRHRAQHLRDEADDDPHDADTRADDADLPHGHAQDEPHDVYARATYGDPSHDGAYADGPYAEPPYAGPPYAGPPYADTSYAEPPYAGTPYGDSPYPGTLHAGDAPGRGPEEEAAHHDGSPDDWAYGPDDSEAARAADQERLGPAADGAVHEEAHPDDAYNGAGGGSSAVDENAGAFALLGGDRPHDETRHADEDADHDHDHDVDHDPDPDPEPDHDPDSDPDHDLARHADLAGGPLEQQPYRQPGPGHDQPEAWHGNVGQGLGVSDEHAQPGRTTRQRRSGTAPGAAAGPGSGGRVSGRGSTRLAGPAPLGARDSVLVNRERGRYHRPDCRYVREATDAVVLTKSRANRQGYSACGVCRP
ncbi:MAG: hypothetical protein M3P93_04870 [Actinomycetota bacterium]|nr:hypothetical protein [Actinomycetota bacterium]